MAGPQGARGCRERGEHVSVGHMCGVLEDGVWEWDPGLCGHGPPVCASVKGSVPHPRVRGSQAREGKARDPMAGKRGLGCDLCPGATAVSTQTGESRQRVWHSRPRGLSCGGLCPLTPALPGASPGPLVRAGQCPLHAVPCCPQGDFREGPCYSAGNFHCSEFSSQGDLWPFPRPTAHCRQGITLPFGDAGPGGPSIAG